MAMARMFLAENGKALGPIIIPTNADRVTRFAASELRKYLKQISGAEFVLKHSWRGVTPGETAVFLGAGPWEAEFGLNLDPSQHPFDGFALHYRGPHLFICGHNPRSTLYGVYALLEEIGCAFIEPGIEHVPRRQIVALEGRNRREVGAFALRNIYAAPNHYQKRAPFTALDRTVTVPQIDWMAKRRLNHYDFYVNFYRYDLWEKHKGEVLEALLDRGFDIEVTHHSLHYFCPPDENHDFGDFGPATYLRNHPDWYLPGLECGARGRWQTRVELPAVQKIIVERFLQYLDRNPELKICGLWPDDIPINRPYRGLSHTDGYMKFWNRAADALAASFPDKLLAIIGYFELSPPPRTVTPRRNIHCWYCPIARNLMYPVAHPRNERFLKWLKGWIKAMPPHQTASFEYYGWQMELTPLRFMMQKDLPLYHDLGLGGIYGWSAFGNSLLGEDMRWAVDLFFLAHQLWDTKADPRKLEAMWAEGVFGRAAPEILDFYAFLARTHAREIKNGLAPIYQWIAFDVVHKAQAILAAARKRAETPAIRRRVDLLEKVLLRGSAEVIWREGKARVV
ncbi:MAG: DUF4838 domain-containing protein [Verrucomicrobia bacterium]|nr:DUF4838 domain-containing protein [Verrucomicrobiota bacterium]